MPSSVSNHMAVLWFHGKKQTQYEILSEETQADASIIIEMKK